MKKSLNSGSFFYLIPMKSIITILCLSFIATTLPAQDNYSKHVQTLDTTIETLYAVISGEKGEKRDWELFKYLFAENARLIPTGKQQDGSPFYATWSPEEYAARAGTTLEENGFFEKEISRKTDRYGDIVQIFSTYESYRSEKDDAPFARGINSIQCWYSEGRWWIVSIFWEGETPENPIPEKYLD